MSNPAPLLSDQWYRLAKLRPRLRAGLHMVRQQARGQWWVVVADPVTGRRHRFSEGAWAIVSACHGQSTLDQVWSERLALLGDQAPTQQDTIRIVAQGFAAHLFVSDVAPQAAALVKAEGRVRRQRRRAAINPFAFRVPLWDADAFLSRHQHRVQALFTPLGLRCIALLMILSLGLLLGQAEVLLAHGRQALASQRMLLLMWLAYPAMKALHELAHAFAVKAYGGEVHKVGLSLLMLTPVPYVDASASVMFPTKAQRATVAAAGIAVELLVAGAALIFWLALQPGLARDLAFAFVVVGTVSTLLVNANPLLRFDGYHVLTDLFELPNLATRSARHWRQWLVGGLLGARLPALSRQLPGETPWLVAYAPLSWALSTALLIGFARALAEAAPGLGLMVLAAALWFTTAQPLWRGLRWLMVAPELAGRRLRGVAAAATGAVAIAVLAVAVPLPQRSHAPGVVWLPDEAIARAGTEGFLEDYLVEDGAIVSAGTPLMRLSNEPLQLALQRAVQDLAQLRVEQGRLFGEDANGAAMADDRIAQVEALVKQLQKQADSLLLTAGTDGRLSIDRQRLAPGQFVEQGEVLGQVLPAGAPLVRALVRNDDIALVRARPGQVRVSFAHGGEAAATATAVQVPQATRALPSPALGEAAGGTLPLDPSDPKGRTARDAQFQFDLRLAEGIAVPVGTRVMVSFQHGSASAVELAASALRQAFLRHFTQ